MLRARQLVFASRGARLYSSAVEPPVMKVVRQNLKDAMRAGDDVRKTTIRAVMAALKNANIDKPDSVTSDLAFSGLVGSLIKKREKSIEEYEAGNRPDLVEKEAAEISVLQQLQSHVKSASDEEVSQHIAEFVKGLQITLEDKAAMGKIMSSISWPVVETEWRATRGQVVQAIKKLTGKRQFSTMTPRLHENPLGLPRQKPVIPRRRPGVAATRRPIPGVKKVVVVSSAKGGVGKSTVSVNLALSLFAKGLTVGVLDVDIFGPSLPKLLNLSGEPRVSESNKLIPKVNYGLQAMSMGFLVDTDKAVAWRGLLVQKALEQLMFEVEWNGLDVLVLDMPPGTGDVQLTLAQQVLIDGAVIVSTPQDIALIDAVRGIDMFKKVDIPILGMVQNMSVFVCPNCQHETHIFGSDGAIKKAENLGIDILGNIPLDAEICESSDKGKPIVVSSPQSVASASYGDIAARVMEKLDIMGK